MTNVTTLVRRTLAAAQASRVADCLDSYRRAPRREFYRRGQLVTLPLGVSRIVTGKGWHAGLQRAGLTSATLILTDANGREFAHCRAVWLHSAAAWIGYCSHPEVSATVKAWSR